MTYMDWNMNNRKQLHEFLWNHVGGTLNRRSQYEQINSRSYLRASSGTRDGLHALLFFGLEHMVRAELCGDEYD